MRASISASSSAASSAPVPVLEIADMVVEFGTVDRPVRAVAGITLNIMPSEVVGIAGESGSGKTTLCAGIMRTLPQAARVRGSVRYAGRSIYDLGQAELRELRGRHISMILQNPMTSLDPLFTVGSQLGEVLSRGGLASEKVEERAVELLTGVRLTAPEMRMRQYPHELSGGMRQRVLIAMAMANDPKLLVADEPTSALDATVQEEVLGLFHEIRERQGTSVIIVTHDLGVIRRTCDRTVIMYAGNVVETGPTEEIFSAPRHPYTKALLAALPSIDDEDMQLSAIPGQVPRLADLGDWCPFADRCPEVFDRCRRSKPLLVNQGLGRSAACWRLEQAP